MATPRSRQAARLRASQRRAQQRARRLALLVAVGLLGVVTLLVTAFGSSSPTPTAAAITAAQAGALPIGAVRPSPKLLATIGNLRIQLPIAGSSVSAIGFHGANDGALPLHPVGRQGNEGLFARLWRRIAGARKDGPVWYQLEGGRAGTEVLDVGAAPGTDVFAPVTGSVVAISDLVIAGRKVGSRIDLRPSSSPSVIVALNHVRVDPAITVGSPVFAATSKLGAVIDIAAVERQSLARHTRDGGNNVALSVYASVGSLP